MRRPGIEPGSTAWKAAMLTTIPPTPHGYNMRPNSYEMFLFKNALEPGLSQQRRFISNVTAIRAVNDTVQPWGVLYVFFYSFFSQQADYLNHT